jgi:hypothetical protein
MDVSLKFQPKLAGRNRRGRGCPNRDGIAGLYRLLILVGVLLCFVASAKADVLQISATGLTRHCPCQGGAADTALVDQGVLQPQLPNSQYFIPVVFPRDGERVCRLSMIYRDVNQNDTMVAQLMRKRFAVGGDALQSPIVMATVKSASGVVDAVRRATTTKIRQPAINAVNSFYYLEVDVPTINLEILGFQIEVKQTC